MPHILGMCIGEIPHEPISERVETVTAASAFMTIFVSTFFYIEKNRFATDWLKQVVIIDVPPFFVILTPWLNSLSFSR